MARLVMDSILDRGRVVRGYLGIQMQPLTEKLAESFGYEGTRGVIIAEVTEDSPAEEAGLQADDILLEISGRRVIDMNQLRNSVATIRPGKTVDVTFFRNVLQAFHITWRSFARRERRSANTAVHSARVVSVCNAKGRAIPPRQAALSGVSSVGRRRRPNRTRSLECGCQASARFHPCHDS